MTRAILSENLTEQIDFFRKRANFIAETKKAIKKYGFANLPKTVKEAFPEDPVARVKVLYELPWFLNIVVLIRIVQIAYANAEMQLVRGALNEC